MDLQPITPLWLVVGLGSAAGLRYLAGPRMDLVVLVMGYAGLALCALALLTVTPAALILWRVLRRATSATPEVLEAGSPVRTGFSIPNLGWLPLVSIEWRWVEPDGVRVEPVSKGLRRFEEVVFEERGRVKSIARQFTVSDVLGLCRVRWTQRRAESLTILPAVGAMRRMPIIQTFQSGDEIPHPAGRPEGGRHELRRYVHGDSARHVVWKIFGKTRRLMVREPERAIARSTNTAAYLVTSRDDEAAAAAARVAVESEVLGARWALGADGGAAPAKTRSAAMEVIAASSRHREMAGRGLAGFMDTVSREGFTRCIVFAPWRPGPWVDSVLSAAASRPGMFEVVVATDGLAPTPKRTLWRRLFTAGTAEAEEAAKVEQLDTVVESLQRGGMRVVVVDRPSGQPIGAATRAALRSGQVPRELQHTRRRR